MAAYTAVDDSEAHFQTVIYTGNGSTQSITLPGTTDMLPDMIWFKRRDDTDQPKLHDAVRGVAARLGPNADSAEVSDDDVVTSFNSDGFSLGDDDSSNASSATHVAWCWKANGTGSSNTSGSINTAATSANTTSGFSIVAYEGSGSADATIGHGLGVKPDMIWFKNRETAGTNWTIFHKAVGAEDFTIFNGNNAAFDWTAALNDTDPTTTLITLGDADNTNQSAKDIVAYCFASVQGFSKFGTYKGNGNADGTFIYTGFRPAFVICKRTDSTQNWMMFDNKRLGYNEENEYLEINNTIAELSNVPIDLLSNGFKHRHTSTSVNASGGTYIFMAVAEAPFVNSNGVPNNAR